MERLVIIDHTNHTLYVEDVYDEALLPYGGDENDYIKDNYNLEEYSWDYIVDTQYLPEDDKTPVEINFENLTD